MEGTIPDIPHTILAAYGLVAGMVLGCSLAALAAGLMQRAARGLPARWEWIVPLRGRWALYFLLPCLFAAGVGLALWPLFALSDGLVLSLRR